MTKLTTAMEHYMETIYLLERNFGEARVTDIAVEMKIAKSSVHTALHNLEDKGLIVHEKYGALKLTDAGKKVAMEIYRRHELLTEFFQKVVGVDAKTAEKDACAIEHVISEASMEKISKMKL